MKNRFTNNLGLKIGSFIIALMLWFIAININDPVAQDSYNVIVQLQNANLLTDSGKYYEILDNSDRIKVTVRGSRTALSSFGVNNIVATADCAKITDDNRIPIEIGTTRISDKIESIRADKEYLAIGVENLSRVQIPISVYVQNEPASGYILGSVSTVQNIVIVSGPESEVSKVGHAAVELNVAEASSDVSVTLPIHLYDSEDSIVDSSKISMSKSEVATTAAILETKLVPISIGTKGTLTDGYVKAGKVESTPGSVLIAGKPGTMKNISVIDIPEAIDVTGQISNIVQEIDIRPYVLDNYSIVGGSSGKVTATVRIEEEGIREIEINASDIHTTNLPDGFRAEVESEDGTVTVELKGEKAILDALDLTTMTYILDIEKYMKEGDIQELEEGTIKIPLSINLPDNVRMSQDVTIQLSITK